MHRPGRSTPTGTSTSTGTLCICSVVNFFKNCIARIVCIRSFRWLTLQSGCIFNFHFKFKLKQRFDKFIHVKTLCWIRCWRQLVGMSFFHSMMDRTRNVDTLFGSSDVKTKFLASILARQPRPYIYFSSSVVSRQWTVGAFFTKIGHESYSSMGQERWSLPTWSCLRALYSYTTYTLGIAPNPALHVCRAGFNVAACTDSCLHACNTRADWQKWKFRIPTFTSIFQLVSIQQTNVRAKNDFHRILLSRTASASAQKELRNLHQWELIKNHASHTNEWPRAVWDCQLHSPYLQHCLEWQT